MFELISVVKKNVTAQKTLSAHEEMSVKQVAVRMWIQKRLPESCEWTHTAWKEPFDIDVVIHQQHRLDSVDGESSLHSPVHIGLDRAKPIQHFFLLHHGKFQDVF